jgi:hypothetical protein
MNCVMASDSCKTFSTLNGQCKSCYGGYKLNKGSCEVSNSSCAEINVDGKCSKCYNGSYLDANS